jgi:recombination protein RecT|nr:MAG TPA: RecT protein [Caudoviricetes sp.]
MANQQQVDLKNQLAKKANGAEPKKKKTVFDVINQMTPEIERALPDFLRKNGGAERFTRIALTQLRTNPALLKCDPKSFIAALMQSSQLGLEPGMLGQSYLIPYGKEVQFQIGYKGLIELARRSGQILSITAHAVHENDEFEFQYGLNENLSHKPNIRGDRGEVYCYYAYATLKDGGHAFTVMSKADVNRIRDKYSKAANSKYSPWNTEYDAMAKKTVIKQLMKYLPVSVELLRGLSQDETIKHEIKEDMTEMPTEDSFVDTEWEVQEEQKEQE